MDRSVEKIQSIRNRLIKFVAVTAAMILFSTIVQFEYVGGDSIVYSKYFSAVANGFDDNSQSVDKFNQIQSVESFKRLGNMLTSFDIGFLLISLIASHFVSHFFFVLIGNILLMWLALMFLRRYPCWLIWFVFLVMGYYGAGVLFAAERLKFAIIVLLFLGILYQSTPKVIYLWMMACLPGLFHVQLFLLSPIFITMAVVSGGLAPCRKHLILFVFTSILMGCVSAFVLVANPFSIVINKIDVYNANVDYIDLLKVFLISAVYVFLNRSMRAVWFSLYFIALVVLLSFDRVGAMFIYLLAFSLLPLDGKMARGVALLLWVAIGLKSFVFYDNVFSCGNAFVCP